MTENPLEDAKKKDWFHDDTRLYLQIKNFSKSEVIGLVYHCESVKELLELLEFIYSGEKQVHRMCEVCMQFFRAEQKSIPVTLCALRGLLLSLLCYYPKVQQTQREKMAVMIFLNELLPEFEMTKAQILSDSKIPLLDDAFICVLCIKSSLTSVSIPQSSSALISKNNNPRVPRAMDSKLSKELL